MSSPTQRGVLATIEKEALVPSQTLPLHSDFSSDLNELSSLLTPTAAAYILLKLDGEAADGYVAVTYVPNAAPVRQKMLFASTRLTLVRELGIERFRETLFVTEKEELTAEGWRKHEAHSKLSAPLTEEEEGLKGIKEAEAQESGGTAARKRIGGGGIGLEVGVGVAQALEGLKEGPDGELVMIVSWTEDSHIRVTTRHRTQPNCNQHRKSMSNPRRCTSTPRRRVSLPQSSMAKSRQASHATASTTIPATKAPSSCTAVPPLARSRSAWSTQPVGQGS